MILKNKLRIFLILFALLLVAIVGVIIIEKKRGKDRLEKARAAFIADGGSFDRKSRFATPVPDDENFGAIPLLNGITADTPDGQRIRDEIEKIGMKDSVSRWPRSQAWRKHGHEPHLKYDLTPFNQFFVDLGLLPSLSPPGQLEANLFEALESTHGPAFAKLQAASTRPSALLLPIAADRFVPGSLMYDLRYDQLTACQQLSKGIMLHALLALRTGAYDTALADIRVMNRLSIAVQTDETTLISHLVGNAITAMSMNAISEGLADRLWTADQLEELQAFLAERDVAEEMRDAIRTEILYNEEVYANFEKIAASSPGAPSRGIIKLAKPWIDHNHAEILELYHHGILIPSKLPDGYVQALIESDAISSKLTTGAQYNPRTILARLTIPVMSSFIKKSARTHADLTLAIAACSLERYYLANQSYPDSLEKLVPEFANQVPVDPANGKGLHYETTPDGRYRMYSTGPDGDDDWGGSGDIAWSYGIHAPTQPKPSSR